MSRQAHFQNHLLERTVMAEEEPFLTVEGQADFTSGTLKTKPAFLASHTRCVATPIQEKDHLIIILERGFNLRKHRIGKDT